LRQFCRCDVFDGFLFGSFFFEGKGKYSSCRTNLAIFAELALPTLITL
jgi:hypothetical protein